MRSSASIGSSRRFCYMGHADVATTMVYVHHVPKTDAAERLSRLVAAETAPEMEVVGA